jgi:hypothetical protein
MVDLAGGLKSAGRRATKRSTSGRVLGLRRLPKSQLLQGLLIAVLSGSLFWVVGIYSNGLRDPRYLDGWVLAGGMILQLYFHIAIKTASLTPKSANATRKFHIFLGYVLIAAFVSHSNFSLPDTGFEWALWACFVMVTLSGIFGAYLAWSLRTKRVIDESVSYDRIPTRYAEIGQDVRAIVTHNDQATVELGLPAPPEDAWIMDLYTNRLSDFFQGPRNATAHLIGSQRPRQRLTDEIDNLSRYVDKQAQEKLEAIKTLVVEKDRLDFARVYLGLNKGWLFVHVPVTYTLIVLSVLHVLVAYAYSSGDW